MNTSPRAHVYVRPELLSFDGERIHLVGGTSLELAPADRAVLDCVLRGESELGLLCRTLADLEIGGVADVIEERLCAVFSDPRSVLALGPPRYVERPAIIVCDFNVGPTPIDGRQLVRRLRERRRVLFLGLEGKVRSSSPDSYWYERPVESGAQPSWFEFAQWARSIIRFHHDAVLVLLGHRDSVLFGDLAASLRSVLVLDEGWPSTTGLADLRGRNWLPLDLIENLRSLYYTLRFNPYAELVQLNRNASSTFAGMEAYAVQHADIVCYLLADQVAELSELGRAPEHSIPACLPVSSRKPVTGSDRTLLLVADMECGFEPLAPFLQLLLSVPPAHRPFERACLFSEGHWFEIQQTESSVSIVAIESPGSETTCSLAFIFPGLLREVRMAAVWLTSGLPVQLVPSALPHPLQVDAEEILLMRRATTQSVYERMSALLDPSTDLRRRVLGAQARLARRWSVVRAIEGLATPVAATPA